MIYTALILAFLTASDTISASGQELDISGWVSLALQNSPAIRASEASVLSAEASLTGDRSFLYPSLSASAGASRSWNSTLLENGDVIETEGTGYSAGLSLSQELLQSAGQNWLYMDASELSLEAAQADHDEAVLQVTLDVVNSWYNVLEALELERSAADAHERSQSQLDRTEALYGIGAVTTLELLQVQVQESTDRLSATRSRQNLTEVYNDLYRAAGLDLSGPLYLIRADAVLEPLPLAAVDDIPLDISGNPSLTAARLRYRAAELRSDASRRSYWPSLRASAGWNWSDDTLDDIDRMFDSDGYNVGLSLSWNVFDGFLRESRINAARASELSSQASLESMENQLEVSVQTLRNSLETDIQYYHDSMLALELAQEKYRLSVMTYEMGGLSLLDLLDAQTELSRTEANLVSARVAALKTEASLMVDLGRYPRLGE